MCISTAFSAKCTFKPLLEFIDTFPLKFWGLQLTLIIYLKGFTFIALFYLKLRAFHVILLSAILVYKYDGIY